MNGTNHIEAQNAIVRQWTPGSVEALRASLSNLGVRKTGLLIRMLKARNRMEGMEITAIRFEFPRYAVYVEKGALRGHGGVKGSRWIGPDGKTRRTNPASLGKMDTGAARARRWFNPVMSARVEDLADQLVKLKGDVAINSILIR